MLGDALHANYVVDPRVQGTVTLQTSKPVSQDALTDILESALAVNGAGIAKRGGTYQIVPLSETISQRAVGVAFRSVCQSPGHPVAEMKTILEPITKHSSVLRMDTTRI